jgi:Na+-transporting NADH:ubiquinone oxidoreductase subunit A
MPKKITIKKGLDIPLKGLAEKQCKKIVSSFYSIKPTDFVGVTPRLLLNEGDSVRVGTPLFHSKANERIKFTSPVSGTVVAVTRGEKRVIQEIVIQSDDKGEQELTLPRNMNDRESIITSLLDAGLWPMIRQRPYHVIANPTDEPKAIFVSGFDSAPLAPDYDFIAHDKLTQIQMGVDVLKKLTQGAVCLGLRNADSPLNGIQNVEVNYFQGPHPAGNVGTQIHHLNPLNKGEVVWTVNLLDLIFIGNYFQSGKLDFSKTIAFTGPSALQPHYALVTMGQSVVELAASNVADGNIRYISGNVLTGNKIDKNGYLGFYDYQLTLIPEGDYFEFMGWMAPGFDKFSLSRTFFSWLAPKKKYALDTNYHGELRNFVVTGQYEKVFPWDILPVQLLKAIIVGDIEMMENLGIYEVAEEDFALCEYVCTSKIESQQLIRKGIEMMQKEMS